MGSSEANPFESPREESPGPVPQQSKRRRKVPSERTYFMLSLQLKVFGALIMLVGLLGLFSSWSWSLIFLGGMAIMVVGFGMAAYKPWAWYGAVLLLVPFSLLFLSGTIAVLVMYGAVGIVTLLAPVYAWTVLWTLMSHSGRQRYDEVRQARNRARDNPDSIAGRLYRKRL